MAVIDEIYATFQQCLTDFLSRALMIGSAGAGLEACGDSPIFGPYSKVGTNQWGYLRVEASEERIKLEFVLDLDGSVWDSYEVLPWE